MTVSELRAMLEGFPGDATIVVVNTAPAAFHWDISHVYCERDVNEVEIQTKAIEIREAN